MDELSTFLGARFCLRTLNAAEICVVRDPGSRDVLERLGYRRIVDVCADPAFHLSGEGGMPDNPPFAVISPISRRAWPGTEDESYDHYLTALALVADQLQSQGIEVRYVCSQTKMDPPVVARVRKRMKGDIDRAIAVDVNTVDDYLAAVAGARVVVGSRLHAMILAMVAGTPVVAISAVRKVRQQFADMGMAELAFDMRVLDVAQLLRRVQDVVNEPDSNRQRVLAVTREFRAQLDGRFDRLAALIPARAAMAR
ncbi:MAG: polysaccharide pyruvyl transferase family protein [Betaproteobacteria bacterium]|nr:polysaccharide pyruvyl transferase family protein [Betaproteobacteria bacterium]